MQIPVTEIYTGSLPETECLALFPGAVIGEVEDPAAELLRRANILPEIGAPVQVLTVPALCAGSLLAATVVSLNAGDKNGVELYKTRLAEAIAMADTLGVREFSLTALPTEAYDSRVFAFYTVLFRVLMSDRENHPCLERIRFFCPSVTDAQWIARVYNFYYPADKSERMQVPKEE